MSKYVFKLTPIDSYFFGGAEKFTYGEKNLKSEYYIYSEKFPQQTAILGTLRYLMLSLGGMLNDNFVYTSDERKLCDKLIGEKSFKMDNNSGYGVIEKVGTIYLYDGENVLAPVPMDCKQSSDTYIPMSINKSSLSTNLNSNTWTLDEYNPKEGLVVGYVNSLGEITASDKIFGTETKAGNKKTQEDKAFFKREFCMLKPGYSFIFEADIDLSKYSEITKNLNGVHLVTMGQKKSGFKLEVIDVGLPTFDFGSEENKLVALSDIFIEKTDNEILNNANLAIYQTKKFSYMKKDKKLDEVKGDFNNVYTRRNEQNIMIKRGSVFVFKSEEAMNEFKKKCAKNTAMTTIGYNNLI